jgi:2-phospho-L-lactate guanylyltransferase
MLAGVIAAAQQTPGVDHVAVVSAERDGLPGDLPLIFEDCGDLNAALALGVSDVRARGADRVVILAADLPNLRAGDIGAMVKALNTAPCVLAPDRHGVGTNGVGLDLSQLEVGAFPLCFGANSFGRHLEAARSLGLAVRIVETPGLALDVDEPDDLAVASQLAPPVGAFAR